MSVFRSKCRNGWLTRPNDAELWLPRARSMKKSRKVCEDLRIVLRVKFVWQLQPKFRHQRQHRIGCECFQNIFCRTHNVGQEQRTARTMGETRSLIALGSKFGITAARIRTCTIGGQDHPAKRDTRRAFMQPFLTKPVDLRLLGCQKIIGVLTADNVSRQEIEPSPTRPARGILRSTTIPQAVGQPLGKRS